MIDINNKFHGKIEVICGPMFSGKTEELIRQIRRLKFTRTDYMVFKPKKDDRYGEFKVATHAQDSINATPVATAEEMIQWCEDNSHVKTIAIDEAQFFDKSVNDGERNLYDACNILRAKGYKIIITGLDMNHLGQPFGFMPELMAVADEVKKLKSICSVCLEDANMSLRLSQNDEEFQLGSGNEYQARCYRHWLEGIKEREEKKKEISSIKNLKKKEEVSLEEVNSELEEIENQDK